MQSHNFQRNLLYKPIRFGCGNLSGASKGVKDLCRFFLFKILELCKQLQNPLPLSATMTRGTDREWERDIHMNRDIAIGLVKQKLIGNKIETRIYDEHCTGEIRLNSKGLGDFLFYYHSSTSEKKWALERLYSKNLSKTYTGYEPLNPNSHNLEKKLKNGFTGFNKYQFSYGGKTFELKCAIIRNEYERPYFISKKK